MLAFKAFLAALIDDSPVSSPLVTAIVFCGVEDHVALAERSDAKHFTRFKMLSRASSHFTATLLVFPALIFLFPGFFYIKVVTASPSWSKFIESFLFRSKLALVATQRHLQPPLSAFKVPQGLGVDLHI